MDTSADLQCEAILKGLENLEAVLDKPVANETLDLKHNVAASEQKLLLVRLRKSLVQYLERSRNLVYVGLIGHFSSGKSSTINSLLFLSGTPDERPTTLNPTDKLITLITHKKNANSLIGIISHGSVPIRMQTIDNDLLNELVLADTPGTGDPHLLEELARDFLPICDLVLFFFSATSPLDATDIPLLTELHRRLPFIPIKFVITRADEHRVDPLQPVTASNFDSTSATRFVGEIMSRLALLPELSKYGQGDFLLIDNKGDFNIEVLRKDLVSRADPANVSSRLAMHSHKVSFFQTTSENLREFFSELLNEKLSELNRVVATAQNNILEYQEVVTITNNNLTRSWLDHQATIQDLQAKAIERIKTLTDLPNSIFNLSAVSKLSAEMRTDIQRQSSTNSEQIQAYAMQTGFMQLKREFSQVQRALAQKDLDDLTAQDHGLGPVRINWTFDGDNRVVPEYYLAKKADDLRETLRSQVLALARELKKHLEEMQDAIQQRYIVERCESIISTAESSLMQDLDVYFQSVKVYHAGVFAMTSQESIAKLGIGRQMDLLLKDFTDEDKQSIKLSAKQGLFPSFDDVVANTTTQLSTIAEQLKGILNQIGSPQIDRSSSQLARIELAASAELVALLDQVKNELQRETDTFIRDIQDQLEGGIATTLIDYDKERSAADKSRKMRYVALTVVMGVGAATAYGLYHWVTRPVGPSLLEVLGWGLLIEIAGNFFGLGLARYKDNYPVKKSEIKKRHFAVLNDKVKVIINAALAHEFSVLQATVLGKKLEKTYTALTFPDSDAWQTMVEDLYKSARTWNATYKELRRTYLQTTERFIKDSARYFEDHKKNLDILKSTAQNIRERAIEPSFDFLAETSQRLEAVQKEISAIRFV